MMRFGEDYPHRAPDVYFVTPILHLNVDSQGKVFHSALDRECKRMPPYADVCLRMLTYADVC
jgi:ubiquitin-protein ligase